MIVDQNIVFVEIAMCIAEQSVVGKRRMTRLKRPS